MFVVLNFNTKLNSPNKDRNIFKATDLLHTKSLHVNVWKLAYTNRSPWMHSQTYGKILPKGSEHYAHHPIPAHPHLLRAGSQARGKVSRFSAGAAVSCPHSLVPVASPCSSGLQLVLPQCSAPVPRGSMVTDGLLQGAGSFQSPRTLWDLQC